VADELPHIKEANLDANSLSLEFDQPMLTWAGPADLAGIRIEPPATSAEVSAAADAPSADMPLQVSASGEGLFGMIIDIPAGRGTAECGGPNGVLPPALDLRRAAPPDALVNFVANIGDAQFVRQRQPVFLRAPGGRSLRALLLRELPAGHHEIRYHARAMQDGHYTAMPAVAELMYGPATVARTAATSIAIAPGGD
jgi:hypothetical protein